MLEKLFHLKEHGTTPTQEILAGISTFMAMAYILAVNPSILGNVMDKQAVFSATILATAGAGLIAAFYANWPIALSAGMGLNAYFAFSVCMGLLKDNPNNWRIALTAVFVEGCIFVILGFFKLRSSIANALPENVKFGVTAGIGLFIAFIGLKSAGVVVADKATFVALGSFKNPDMVLCLIGVLLIMILMHKNVKGAVIIGIIAVWIMGMIAQLTGYYVVDPKVGNFSVIPSFVGASFVPPSIAPTFLQFDFGWALSHLAEFTVVMFSFLFVDIFDTVGVLLGVSKSCHFKENDKGEIEGMEGAFTADAIGTALGACLGTSTITTFIESGVGVAEGGRTGLTALTTSIMFLLALFLAPIFLAIPAFATSPALIVVGMLMFLGIGNIDFKSADLPSLFGAYMAAFMMPITYSISNGIMFAVLGWVGMSLFTENRWKLPKLSYVLAIIFLIYICAH